MEQSNLSAPYLIFDDVFNSLELDMIKRTLGGCDWKVSSTEDHGAAPTGKKKGMSCNLGLLYPEATFVFPTNALVDIQNRILAGEYGENHWVWRYFDSKNVMTSIAAKYEVGDYYKAHFDHSMLTILCFFAEDYVLGGDLVLEHNTKINFKHNRVVIMPGVIIHEVTPVVMGTRYSITILIA
jgi:hypothetical protein